MNLFTASVNSSTDLQYAQISYNTAQLRVVSYDGSFCNTSYQKDIDSDNYDNCHFYYTVSELNLYYGLGNPGTNSFERFDKKCVLFINSFFQQVPKVDFNIKPDEAINTTSYPKHGEELLIYSPPPVNVSFNFVQAVNSQYIDILYLSPTTGEAIYCLMSFAYRNFAGVVFYSYIEMHNYNTTDCSCLPPDISPTCKNLRYAYRDSQTQQLVELNSCYTLPQDKVRPIYEPNYEIVTPPICPCF